MDDIKKSDCDFRDAYIHYYIDNSILCLPKSLPEHILLQYRLLIEIFGFQIGQCHTRMNDLRCFVEDNYALHFNMYWNRYYILYHTYYGLAIESENFEDVIRYMDKYYSHLRIVPMQKLVQNIDM